MTPSEPTDPRPTAAVIGAGVAGLTAAYLLRHGGATRVTSLVYLTPAFAIVPEFLWFGITPSTISWAGIVITCMGVGLVVWRGSAETRR